MVVVMSRCGLLWILGWLARASLLKLLNYFPFQVTTPHFMKVSVKACRKAFRHPQILTAARDWLIHQAGVLAAE